MLQGDPVDFQHNIQFIFQYVLCLTVKHQRDMSASTLFIQAENMNKMYVYFLSLFSLNTLSKIDR